MVMCDANQRLWLYCRPGKAFTTLFNEAIDGGIGKLRSRPFHRAKTRLIWTTFMMLKRL